MRCLAARVNYKTLIVICALFTLITVLLWNRCSSDTSLHFLPRAALVAPSPKVGDASISSQQHPPQPPEPPPVVGVAGGIKYEEIDCLINDESTIKGRREGGEVFLPFSWMEKYFEVYGKVVQYDGYERFEFQHSYSKVYTQREPYHPDGVFMSFEGYNVEVRDRVKCISGVEGRRTVHNVANVHGNINVSFKTCFSLKKKKVVPCKSRSCVQHFKGIHWLEMEENT